METYSTVLFHLLKEVAMSTLAQDMVAIDKTCAEVCKSDIVMSVLCIEATCT